MLPALEQEAKKRRNQAAGQPQGTKSVPSSLEEQTSTAGESAGQAAAITGVSKSWKQFGNRVSYRRRPAPAAKISEN